MKRIREVFEAEIKEIDNGRTRKIFRTFIGDAFEEIIKTTKKKLDDLKRIGCEKEVDTSMIVFHGLVSKEKYFEVSEVFFPYFEEDKESISLEEKYNGGSGVLAKVVVLERDNVLKEIEKAEFEAVFSDGQNEMGQVVKLVKDNSYREEEEKLRELFVRNNERKTVLYSPYSNKIYKVIIKDKINSEQELGKITKIDINFGGYENNIYFDQIPIWNVKKATSLNITIPKHIEGSYYEHKLEIKEHNKVLVDRENVEILDVCADRMGNLSLLADSKNVLDWNLYIIKKINDKRVFNEFSFEVFDNGIKNSAVESLKRECGRRIRSLGEIYRIKEMCSGLKDINIKRIISRKGNVFIEIEIERNEIFSNEIKKYFLGMLEEVFWENNFRIVESEGDKRG